MKASDPTLTLDIQITVGAQGISAVVLAPGNRPGIHWKIHAAKKQDEQPIDCWMNDYVARRQPTVDLRFDLEALPNFTSRTLLALSEIPFGETISYATLAKRLGVPSGPRAVGQACGRNPIPLLLPCHRVIASTGGLGGFGLGLDLKQRLLAFEGH